VEGLAYTTSTLDPPNPIPPACRATLLKMEEEWIQKTCEQIGSFKPDVVITGGYDGVGLE